MAGDVDYKFSIQSVSKPFTAALVMSLQGTEAVREKIGVEPTGLPAKTGVGGGIVAVVPGKFAIATFSARLNEAGNSIRGLRAIRDIAGEMGVGIYVGIYGPNPE